MNLPFEQTFQIQDLALLALLVVLEGVLSIDNALVLGLLAKRLPKNQRARALTYGLVGAFVFRLLAILMATLLLRSAIAKLLGGLYLLYVAGKYFFEQIFPEKEEEDSPQADVAPQVPVSDELKETVAAAAETGKKQSRRWLWFIPEFWSTVIVIELTDIAFAVDSIVAAMGVVGAAPKDAKWHPKLWVVFFGGFMGLILMRYAATVFIRLLEKFPRFETAAYLLVAVIGGKLILDWGFHFDFHNPKAIPFWIFWLLMLLSFSIGFLPKKGKDDPSSESTVETETK